MQHSGTAKMSIFTSDYMSESNQGLENRESSILEILKKHPKLRTEQELAILEKKLEGITFFQESKRNFEAESYQRLYQEILYENHPRRSVLFKIGDIGRKFYIILKGNVHVLLKKVGIEAAKNTNEEPKDKEDDKFASNKKLNSLVHKVMKDNLKKMEGGIFSQSLYDQFTNKKGKKGTDSNPFEDLPTSEFLDICFPSLYKVRTLGQGDSFGELALRESVARTATIVLEEETHFAVLTKDIYTKVIAFNQDKIHSEHIEFLKTLLPFKGWHRGDLDQIFYQMEEKGFKKGQIIYKEGESPDRIFFIREGEVEISRLIKCKIQDSGANTNQNMLKLSSTHRKLLRIKAPDNNEVLKRVAIAYLGRGCTFGQEEILTGAPRESQAKANTVKTRLFTMSRDKFFSMVTDKRSLTNIFNMTHILQENREELMDNIRHTIGEREKLFFKDKRLLMRGSTNMIEESTMEDSDKSLEENEIKVAKQTQFKRRKLKNLTIDGETRRNHISLDIKISSATVEQTDKTFLLKKTHTHSIHENFKHSYGAMKEMWEAQGPKVRKDSLEGLNTLAIFEPNQHENKVIATRMSHLRGKNYPNYLYETSKSNRSDHPVLQKYASALTSESSRNNTMYKDNGKNNPLNDSLRYTYNDIFDNDLIKEDQKMTKLSFTKGEEIRKSMKGAGFSDYKKIINPSPKTLVPPSYTKDLGRSLQFFPLIKSSNNL